MAEGVCNGATCLYHQAAHSPAQLSEFVDRAGPAGMAAFLSRTQEGQDLGSEFFQCRAGKGSRFQAKNRANFAWFRHP